MTSIKCASCGLVNFANIEGCKRCGSNLQSYNPSSGNLVAQPIIDYTEENRLTGLIMLAAGLFFAGLPWGLAFGLGILIGKLNGICIALGFPFAIVGYATVVSPPITILKAEENKNRNGAFMLLGFVLAGIEAYFFNKAVGFW